MNAMEYVLYGARSRFVTTKRILEGHGHYEDDRPKPNPYRPSVGTPIRDLVGIITPSSLHFATQHHYGIPEINPSEHTLTIHGMVDRPMVFTVDDLKRFPASSGIYFLECLGCTSSNQSGPMSSFRKSDFLPVIRPRRCV